MGFDFRGQFLAPNGGLLSLEIASIFLVLGAQVIAEYERLQDGEVAATTGELKTDKVPVEVS